MYKNDEEDDMPICVCQPAEKAAEAMGLTLGSFWCALHRSKKKQNNRWIIFVYKTEYDEEEITL